MTVEVSAENVSGLDWRKSSYSSNGNEGDCVEVASASRAVRVRDSKSLHGPLLVFGQRAWTGFVSYAAGH
ncbi:DUF397 domain-containing protein [Streptomyces sp. NPDC057682]|uniref:DUF397 domain-containing protein n=1 Tax=Streptomyces sp. NPDC057682 TaxID=3346210 RepID=UPI0036861E0C